MTTDNPSTGSGQDEPTVGQLQKELAQATKRIERLEAFVGEVLTLSRYPWLHPERAPEVEEAQVAKLLAHAWHLLPTDSTRQPTSQPEI